MFPPTCLAIHTCEARYAATLVVTWQVPTGGAILARIATAFIYFCEDENNARIPKHITKYIYSI